MVREQSMPSIWLGKMSGSLSSLASTRCPAWLLGLRPCIYSWYLLNSRTSFLPTVFMIWLPSFILFFIWVVSYFFPNWFVWYLCKLRKLALFIYVANTFLVSHHMTLFIFFSKCLDKFDHVNILISFELGLIYVA